VQQHWRKKGGVAKAEGERSTACCCNDDEEKKRGGNVAHFLSNRRKKKGEGIGLPAPVTDRRSLTRRFDLISQFAIQKREKKEGENLICPPLKIQKRERKRK